MEAGELILSWEQGKDGFEVGKVIEHFGTGYMKVRGKGTVSEGVVVRALTQYMFRSGKSQVECDGMILKLEIKEDKVEE